MSAKEKDEEVKISSLSCGEKLGGSFGCPIISIEDEADELREYFLGVGGTNSSVITDVLGGVNEV